MKAEHMNREHLFVEISEERSAQDAQWGGEPHDDGHAPTEWFGFIENQIARAKQALTEQSQDNEDPDTYRITRVRLMRIAALAVAGIESIDRCVDAG